MADESDEDNFHDAYAPGLTIESMLSSGVSPTSDSGHSDGPGEGNPYQSALDHNEAMYRQLLDMVDLGKSDEGAGDDGASDAGDDSIDGVRKPAGPAPPEITDPQVLDLFVVFGKPFALDREFLVTGVGVAALQGGFMGFVCLGFFNSFGWVSKTWLGCWEPGAGPWPHAAWQSEYLEGMKNGEAPAMMGTGRWWWLLVTTGAGLLIGIIKLVKFVHFPVKPKGLFSEVKELHVEPREAPGIVLCSAISLACGASVGPEMAMGCLGGGIGTYIAHERNLGQDETYSSTLTGMAAAMGPLLPSPILAVLLLHELCVVAGRPPKHFMETVCSTGIAATFSWFVYFFFADVTFLDSMAVPVAFYDIVKNVTPYKQEWLAESALFGIIGGLIGLLTLIIMGAFRNVGNVLMMRLGHRKGTLLLPVVGGLFLGLIGVAFPLTFGDGSLQLKYVVASTFGDGPNKLGRDYLIATMFMKIITLSISQGFGFIGGQIFPCIFIGTCAGTIATIVSGVPIIVTVPCFMVAVPGAFCPIPFTLVGIGMVSLVLGNELSTLVFVSVIFSFMTACGTGVIQRILKKGGERQAVVQADFAAKKKAKAEALKLRLQALQRENTLLRRLSTDAGIMATPGEDLRAVLQRRVSVPVQALAKGAEASGGSAALPPRRYSTQPAPRIGRNLSTAPVQLNHPSPYL